MRLHFFARTIQSAGRHLRGSRSPVLYSRLSAFLLALGLLAANPSPVFSEPQMELSASRSEIYLGESFVLQVKASQANGAEPDLSSLTNAVVRKLGSQDISNFSIVIVNGQMRREGFSGRIHAYEIQPLNAGPFTAGPVRLGSVSEPGPVISVMGIETQDVVQLSVVANPATVLANEPFQISLHLRVRSLPANYAGADPFAPDDPPLLQIPYLSEAVDGLEAPNLEPILNGLLVQDPQRSALRINDFSIRNDPFNMQNFFKMNGQSPFEEHPARFLFPRNSVVDQDHQWIEYTFDLPYQAAKEGTYTFGPVLFKGKVVLALKEPHQLSLRTVFAVGPAATVRVIPPPETGRPDSYVGVLGSNLTASAELDAQTCLVGDPLTLTLNIAGPVQWRNVTPLRLSLQTNLLNLFTIYQDQVQTVKGDQSRQFIYTLRPVKAGTFEVPPIAVSYYDAKSRDYRTIWTEPVPIRVNPSAEFTAAQVVGQSTNRPNREQAPAPVPVVAALRLDPSGAKPGSLTGSRALLGVAGAMPILALLLWLGRAGWHRRQYFRQAWSRRRALHQARHQLHLAAHSPAAIDTHFHQLLCDVIRRFLIDRLDIEAGPLTPDEIRGRIIDLGIDPLLANRVRSTLELHSHAQFGAQSFTGETPDQIVRGIEVLLTALDRIQIRRPSRVGKAVIVLFTLALTAGIAQAQPEEGAFLWQEANSRMQTAQSPSDFALAADIYHQMVERGICNGPVFINWGIALFQAGHPIEAREAFLRAERYVGSDPEIVRSLRLATVRAEKNPDAALPWYRIPLFWHYALPCALRVQIAAIAFILAWIALIAGFFGGRRWARRLAWVALLILALFGSSALTTLQLEGLLFH